MIFVFLGLEDDPGTFGMSVKLDAEESYRRIAPKQLVAELDERPPRR